MAQPDIDGVPSRPPRDDSALADLAVITPSFRPDAELFADLHASVLRHTGERVVHHVIVPDVDRPVFQRWAGPRCRVWTASELLPGRYLRLPRLNYRVNVRRPWPPVRGWVMQQALKIAAAEALDAEVVLMADSDVVLVRDVSAATFAVDGKIPLFRMPDAVHAGMPDHVQWHRIARRLLGLPPLAGLPQPDYVSALNVWSPGTVRAMQRRITEVTGRHWMDAFTAQLQISEFILYGVFVDEIMAGSGSSWPGDASFCHNYWETTPLDRAGAIAFADRLDPAAIGMMISAKSHTPHEVRQAAIERCAEVAGDGRAVER
jgi:hypothetical protein